MRAIERAGFRPGDEVAISLDIAASEFGAGGRYRLGLEGRELDSDGMIELLIGWLDRYPIVSIEDPLAEDDAAGLRALHARRRAGCRSSATISSSPTPRACAPRPRDGACNAVLIKPNQAGTVSETRAALDAARAAGWGAIVSARSGETEDVTIVHLAVGWDAGQLKVGSFARSERMAKWNEGLRIEEALGGSGALRRRARCPGGDESAACSIASCDRNSRPMRRWSSDQGPSPATTKTSAATAHRNGYSKPSVFQK